MKSNQEEADTKVILHGLHALQLTLGDVVIPSPSGDADILVLMVSLTKDKTERVFLDNGTGQHRHTIRLSDLDMSDETKDSPRIHWV